MAAISFAPLPEGTATMSPGPELAAAIASIDPARVAPRDTAVVLAATRRQLSHTEATHSRMLRECALADPREPGGRRDDYGPHSSGEPRTVLGESRTRVQNAMGLAEDAFVRLPALGAAWDAGDIDIDRVRTLCHWTRALSDAHATQVVETVLPEALLNPGSGVTLSSLIERIAEVATALDSTWAARTYNAAAAQQRVRARRTEAGTVNLSGLDLPLDEATRSTAHIATLAARAKAGGHPGGIDTIRARIYLLLLSVCAASRHVYVSQHRRVLADACLVLPVLQRLARQHRGGVHDVTGPMRRTRSVGPADVRRGGPAPGRAAPSTEPLALVPSG